LSLLVAERRRVEDDAASPPRQGRLAVPKTGVYRLTTKFGEDYMPMGETVGEDNVLRAIVTVS
jgi:hypothetical protein